VDADAKDALVSFDEADKICGIRPTQARKRAQKHGPDDFPNG
jgi:hypothetical protein